MVHLSIRSLSRISTELIYIKRFVEDRFKIEGKIVSDIGDTKLGYMYLGSLDTAIDIINSLKVHTSYKFRFDLMGDINA